MHKESNVRPFNKSMRKKIKLTKDIKDMVQAVEHQD